MATACFGDIAVELGYLSPEQLARVLALQTREDEEARPHRRVGSICGELGFMTDDQIETVLERVEHQRWLRRSIQGILAGGPGA